MRILVTGSSGRVGGAICAHLAPRHALVGIDIKPGQHTDHLVDICDRAAVEKHLPDTDAVIHTASLHAPHVGVRSGDEFRRTNIEGTRSLLAACRRHGVRRVVYTSTTSLYGHAMEPRDGLASWVTEAMDPVPRDIYDETKIAAEAACRSAAGDSTACISLRISRCFPEPADLMAIYRLYRGVDLRDVAAAHELALTADLSGYQVFNISAETPFRKEDRHRLMTDAAQLILRHFPGADREFAHRGWRLPERIDRVYVIERAKSFLGYSPRYNFEDLMTGR